MKKETLVCLAYLLIGILIGGSITILFVDRYYKNQLESINKQFQKMQTNIIPNITFSEG